MANQAKPRPLLLEKKPVEFVKPLKHTPCGNLSLSTLDNEPINEPMYAYIYVYEPNEKNQNDPVSLLRKALSDLLLYYYPVSGKLVRRKSDGKFQLVCIGEGVPFAVATADHDLCSLNYVENFADEVAMQLVHELDVNFQSDNGCHPLSLQVTKFSCGGFTIGIAVTHVLCDGYGVATIFNALTELARGKSELSVVPVWQRERLVGKLDGEPAKVPGADYEGLMATSPYMPSDLRNTGLFESMDFGWNKPVNIWPLTPQKYERNFGIIMRPPKLDPSMEDLRNTGLFESMDFGWNKPVNIWPLTPQKYERNFGIIMRPPKLDPSME
ncbi:hypothetical protein F2Q70_00013672, partial [Brassica cretica]